MEGGIKAAKMGHEVVMSPTTYCYLDYTQGDHSLEFPIYADLSLKKSYSFEPVPEGVDAKFILGGQGNLWTEQIQTLDHAFYMTYPRALAIAETVWSPKEKKDWNQFISRVEHHFDRFEQKGRSISHAVYDPIIEVSLKNEELFVGVTSELNGVNFYYTTDHSFPNLRTPKYEKPIVIPDGQNVALKVVAYRNGKQIGRMISLHRDELMQRAQD
jgi:hexosaminidase